MKSLSRATLAALFLGTLVPIVTASNATALGGSQGVISWLAAGDSYASGAGLPNTNSPCAQGTGKGAFSSTWAVVAARKLTAEGWSIKGGGPTLVACTGAISDEFFTSHTGDVGGSHPQQWNASMGRFNLVTFSFGGGDLGFASILQHCLSTGCPPDAAVRSKIHQLATTGVYKGSLLIPSYPVFLSHVANAAVTTGGNVVVMGYPEIFEDPSLWPAALKVIGKCQGFDAGQANLIRGWAGDLNATLGQTVAEVNAEPAAKRNNVHFTFIDPVTGHATNAVSSSDPNLFEPAQATRHELCSDGDKAWLNGFSPAHPTTRSYHPDQAGNNAMGALAAEVISRIAGGVATKVPVKVCSTTNYGVPSGSSWPAPAPTTIVKLWPSIPGKLAAYVPDSGGPNTLAPLGWNCTAIVGGDGTTLVTIKSAQNPTAMVGSYTTYGTGPMYWETCPFFDPFPDAFEQKDYGPCPQKLPSYESETKLSPREALFSIPAGDGQRANAIGGLDTKSYAIHGLAMYMPSLQGSYEVSCALPSSSQDICDVVISGFRDAFN